MPGARPLYSVVVPTRDRPSQLARCLGALAEQEYPDGGFEVIVVDDGGKAPLDSWTSRFSKRLDLTVLRQPNRGPSTARNHGAESARGRFVAFTDDDVESDPGWLAAFAAAHRRRPGDALGGKTLPSEPDNAYASTAHLIIHLAYSHYNGESPGFARFFASNNLALPADRFRELGGFNPRFRTSEDRELCDRWVEPGHAMTFVPDAVVRHDFPATLPAFIRQHYRYGRGAFAYHRERARRGLGLSGFNASFHRRVMLEQGRRAIADREPARFALLCAWQLANAAGFAREALSTGRRAR